MIYCIAPFTDFDSMGAIAKILNNDIMMSTEQSKAVVLVTQLTVCTLSLLEECVRQFELLL